MHNVATDRLLTASGEQRKKEHKTGSAVKKPLFPDLNAENWKTSGKKFLTLFAVFALLFAILPAHLVAADSSSSNEIETGTGSISGFLWVDGNGMLPTDWNGFYDTGEQPLAGYPIYLYAANDLTIHLAQTQTDWDGTYIFENLEPGNYVAGLASSLTDSAEYLLPMSVTGENKFAIDWRSNPIMAFTGTLIVTANGSIENINGGMRLPVGFVPAGITTTTGGGGSGGYSGAAFIMSLPSAWADIDLADSDGSLTDATLSAYYQYSGGVLTIKQDAPASTEPVAYRIWQNGAHSVTGIVVNTGVTTSIIIDGITMTGDFDLQGNADVDLLLAGDNTISGSVLVPNRGGMDIATIRIDSATMPGSSVGSLTATSSLGSGIGGGSGSGGTIEITGGTVTATSFNGAGIGGGNSGGSGGTITITGDAVVTATSNGGAGIGGGYFGGSSGTITITDNAVVTATSVWGAGIGGGYFGSGGTISLIGNSAVTATSNLGAGIGGGILGSGADITIDSTATVKAYSGGYITADAIHAVTVSGDGFFVNNNISTDVGYDRDIAIFNAGTTNQVNTLTLPADLRCYAYSTGNTATENFNEFMSNNATGDHIGWIVRNSDGSPLIGSVNNNQTLPVRLETNYFIIYNPNGGGPGTGHYQNSGVSCVSGSGTGAVILANTDSSVNMITGPTNAFFIGWNDAPDGSGNSYVAGEPSPINGNNIILYAQWGYTITEKYVDVDGNPINPPGTSATDVLQSSGMYSKTIPTLSGYGAVGWMWEADYLLLSGSDFPITTATSGLSVGSPSSVAVSDDGTVYFVYADVLEKVPGQGSGFGNATIVNQQGSSSQPEQGRQQESGSGSESGSGIKEQQPAGGPEPMPGTDYLWSFVILLFMTAIGFYLFFLLWKKREDDEEEEIKAKA